MKPLNGLVTTKKRIPNGKLTVTLTLTEPLSRDDESIRMEVASCLKDKGANLLVVDRNGKNLLHHALLSGKNFFNVLFLLQF